MSQKLDVILVGVTGYTGRITCRYLHGLQSLAGRWGIAARNAAKMEGVKRSLGLEVPSFVVDFSKPETLDTICRGASCVLSCAGPFSKIGMPVVEACMRNKTHYLDSTGEFGFVRLVSERFHEEAKAKGIVLIPCCGFDCVPSDIGNYVVHRSAHEDVKEIKVYYEYRNAGMSCGTANSVGAVFETITRADMSPTSLVPAGAPMPHSAPSRMIMSYDRAVGKFVAPYMMASGNERLVRRTNALMGSKATYSEAQVGGFLESVRATLSFWMTGLVMSIAPVRRWCLGRFYPADATDGPADGKKSDSFYKATFIGTTVSGARVEVVVSEDREMYISTGVFLGQCVLSVLELVKRNAVKPGVMTPCSALGDDIVQRCADAGVTIQTVAVPKGSEKKEK